MSRLLRNLFPLGFALLASACSTFMPTACKPFDPQTTAEELARIQCQANTIFQNTNTTKSAQMDLANRYEHGYGVERDINQAIRYYKGAARAFSGTTYVYMAPVSGQKYGTTMPVTSGPDTPGRSGAMMALARIYFARRADSWLDRRRAKKWAKRAAKAGYGEAEDMLEEMEIEAVGSTEEISG